MIQFDLCKCLMVKFLCTPVYMNNFETYVPALEILTMNSKFCLSFVNSNNEGSSTKYVRKEQDIILVVYYVIKSPKMKVSTYNKIRRLYAGIQEKSSRYLPLKLYCNIFHCFTNTSYDVLSEGFDAKCAFRKTLPSNPSEFISDVIVT